MHITELQRLQNTVHCYIAGVHRDIGLHDILKMEYLDFYDTKLAEKMYCYAITGLRLTTDIIEARAVSDTDF